MENKAHALTAGLFTLLLGVAVIVAAMWFTGESRDQRTYVLESRHEVSGLSPQAAVRYRGVDVGRVTGIRFDPADSSVILISIVVGQNAPVTRSTYAQLRYQGVTGLSFIMLDDVGDQAQALPPADEPGSVRIPVKEGVFASIAEAGQQVLDEARTLAERMNTLLNEQNQAKFSRTLDNIEAATRQITVLTRAMEPAAKALVPLIADSRRAVQSADNVLIELSGVGKDISQQMQVFARLGASAEKAGTAVESMTEQIAVDSLPRINILLEDLTRTSRNIDLLVSNLREQPQSLVFGRREGPPGPGEPGFGTRTRPER
jgi:phospholipid/cholesterol/gamma-HCH transport system substrate-binding protein